MRVIGGSSSPDRRFAISPRRLRGWTPEGPIRVAHRSSAAHIFLSSNDRSGYAPAGLSLAQLYLDSRARFTHYFHPPERSHRR